LDYLWHDVLGTIGVGCIIGAYLLLQIGSLRVEQLRYSLLNALGAGLILISLRYSFNASAAMVEAFWLVISIFGVARAAKRKMAARGAAVKGSGAPEERA
jgi:hypothetical protein